MTDNPEPEKPMVENETAAPGSSSRRGITAESVLVLFFLIVLAAIVAVGILTLLGPSTSTLQSNIIMNF